ncbi:hypothetical protein BH20ACT9_BH20ACT9_05370 [soil metagenome]
MTRRGRHDPEGVSAGGHDGDVLRSFTAQAGTLGASAAMNAGRALDVLLGFAEDAGGTDWVEVACGPGILSRRLAAGGDRRVVGVDLTPAMVEQARRHAAADGLANAHFVVGDAYALPLSGRRADGVVTRFSLHHFAVPILGVREMARVVRPGGAVVIADHVCTDERAAAWHQSLERLRDPAHWASLTAPEVRALGREAGLELTDERLVAFGDDFEDWWARGGQGDVGRQLAETLLAGRPAGVPGFETRSVRGRRALRFTHHVTCWRRPRDERGQAGGGGAGGR